MDKEMFLNELFKQIEKNKEKIMENIKAKNETETETENKTQCDCPNCQVKEILKDRSYWKDKKAQERMKFKIGEKLLEETYGDNLEDWLDVRTNYLKNELINTKDLIKILDDIEKYRITEIVCNQNIERLERPEQQQK